MERCGKHCKHLIYKGGLIVCNKFNKKLEFTLDLELYKCQECINNQINNEDIKKLKNNIMWLADGFYSFKEDFDTILNDIYNSIEELENNELK